MKQPSKIGVRLAIVISHPIQYFSPWFRWMRTNTDLTFRVFYLSDFGVREARDEKFERSFAWDVDLLSGYDSEFVPNAATKPDTLAYSGLKNPTLHARLRDWDPTAILVFGYNYSTHLRLIFWARLHRIPLIFRGDSHVIGRARLPWKKRMLLRCLYAQFASVTYVGQANREYFRQCGVPTEKLFFAPHAVNSQHFRIDESNDPAKAKALRKSLSIPEPHRIILFAGKMIAQKQPILLAESFIRSAIPNTTLVFVGDGPEKSRVETLAAANQQASIRFLPFANQSEMPSRYRVADVFVLPSRGNYETWGLAINEAMHLAVPCIVSDHVGCQQDLVTDGVTGWVFQADLPETLDAALRRSIEDLHEREAEMKRAIQERISHYTYWQTSEGLLAALDHALEMKDAARIISGTTKEAG